MSGHRIRWWAVGWDREGNTFRIPRSSSMRGEWGWDASCSCGWETRTGGAVRRYVEREIRLHKILEAT